MRDFSASLFLIKSHVFSYGKAVTLCYVTVIGLSGRILALAVKFMIAFVLKCNE